MLTGNARGIQVNSVPWNAAVHDSFPIVEHPAVIRVPNRRLKKTIAWPARIVS